MKYTVETEMTVVVRLQVEADNEVLAAEKAKQMVKKEPYYYAGCCDTLINVQVKHL